MNEISECADNVLATLHVLSLLSDNGLVSEEALYEALADKYTAEEIFDALLELESVGFAEHD